MLREVIRVDPNTLIQNDWCPDKSSHTDRDTEGEPCDDTGRNWGDAAKIKE